VNLVLVPLRALLKRRAILVTEPQAALGLAEFVHFGLLGTIEI
jgi:hypothetical protein